VIDRGLRSAVGVATRVAGASRLDDFGECNLRMGVRTVKYSWGVIVIGDVNRCTY